MSILVGDMGWEPKEEVAVRRKFDFTITPLVTVMYMLCAIDRYTLSLVSQPSHGGSRS